MNYEDFLPIYPDIDVPGFQQQILNKKEFYDLKLTREIEPVQSGDLLNHQKLMQRFMSSNTLYDELLLYHETGTGKTGVAFSVTEGLYASKSFVQVLVFARGTAHLTSLLKELVYKFSQRYPVPENIDEDKKIRYMRKRVSDFYRFHTFETFASRLRGLSDETLQNRYSNTVFIVDEVHHFKSDSDANVYKQFHRLFHATTNRKVLLMTGTPMRDDVNEIAYIMNLILPLDQQLPIGKRFDEEYIDRQDQEITGVNQLKSVLRGRVSYLSSSPVDTRSKYFGTCVTPIEVDTFKVYTTTMQNPQLASYIDAYQKDLSKEGSIYSRSRQASLFVFPDGSYGKEGLDRYLTPSGEFIPEMASVVRTLPNLAKHSSKYAMILQHIVDNPNKLVYIYCSSVSGSGIQVLSLLLKLYGFKPYNGKEKRPGKRFIALSSEVADVDTPLSYFNRPENRYGEFCQVIVCSRKMSESFTFKNIQIIHVTTMHWNYTEIQQAVARGIRFGSHSDLIQDGVIPIVEIYQHASILPPEFDEIKSLDVLMVQASQDKDILIRKMDRVLKEISFDCPLNYERNYRSTGVGSRECDYQDCAYSCDNSGLEQTIEDLGTFRLYYQNRDDLLLGIRKVFARHFSLQFETIQDILQLDQMSLLKGLSDCVRLNMPIVNRYGIECYLREDRNRFYLVDNIALTNDHQELGFYTEHPLVTRTQSLKEVIRQHMFMHNIQRIEKLHVAKNVEEARLIVDNLPLDVQEKIIEEAIPSKAPLGQFIRHIYEKHLTQTDGKIYSDLLEPRIRCFDPKQKVWRDCPKPAPEKLPEAKEEVFEVKVDVENNPYGFYGIVEEDRFCIRDIRQAIQAKNGKIDKRKIKTGSNCLEVGFNKPKLAEICIHLGIHVPGNELDPNPRAELAKSGAGKKLLEEWNRWDDHQLAVGLYWYNKSKRELCGILKEWFAKHGLLVREKCGQSGKIKETLRSLPKK